MGIETVTATFHVGDAIEVMGKLPEKSVDLILTSPPFLALRSYLPADHPDKALEGGSQATPGEYIDWLLDVVEACARVLAPHGSLCFELGDTYAGTHARGVEDVFSADQGRVNTGRTQDANLLQWRPTSGEGWPLAKSLSLIPETFRFAMVYGVNPHTGRQTEPWRLRNVIRWVRPNPPVGALGDKFRPATSELMVFCKAKDRFFDLDAVRESYSEGTLRQYKASADDPLGTQRPTAGEGPKEKGPGGWMTEQKMTHPAGAPPLDWWNIPPGGYPGAHYAVWPPELLIKPIKAMCPEKVCRTCGEPSRRIVGEAEYTPSATYRGGSTFAESERLGEGVNQWNSPNGALGSVVRNAPTLGFSDCGHRPVWHCKVEGTYTAQIPWQCESGSSLTPGHQDDDWFSNWRPGVVLDPFAGSGTTLAVATGHGRDAMGIDLDERNYDLALDRVGPFILERAS